MWLVILFWPESWLALTLLSSNAIKQPLNGELQLYIHADWCSLGVTHFKSAAALQGLLTCQDSTLKTTNYRHLTVSLRGHKEQCCTSRLSCVQAVEWIWSDYTGSLPLP